MNNATITSHNQMNRSINHAYKSVNQTSNKVYQDKEYEYFSEIAPQKLGLFENLTNKINYTNNRLNNNKLLNYKLEEYNNTLITLTDILEDAIRETIIFGLPEGDLLPLSDKAEQYMNQIKNCLSTTFGGQYLFSGSKTNVAPIANVAQISNITEDGVINSNYYLGDNIKPTQNISTTIRLDYAITADDPVFQKFFAAFHNIKKYDSSREQSYLSNSIDLLQEVKSGMNEMIASIGSCANTLSNIIQEEEVNLQIDRETVNSIINIEEQTVFTDLSLRMAKLQAVFTVAAKASDMLITNYIK